MCFSVNVNLVKEELESRYGATLIDPDNYRPSYYYHAFGLPDLPVLSSGSPSSFRIMTWGLIPYWTNGIENANEIRYKTFNARSESIEQKPSFSSSFRSKRCIIPVRGFFEWQHVGKEKIPWYIYNHENEIMSLAGLYDEWVENNSGEVYNTFSVITTDANELMAEIHNSGKRMPVILEKSLEKVWLDLTSPGSDLPNMLKPAPPEFLKAHTISAMVNDKKADRNRPELIQPYNYASNNLLF
jgi:putative SOS response-associated peptidase YedK